MTKSVRKNNLLKSVAELAARRPKPQRLDFRSKAAWY